MNTETLVLDGAMQVIGRITWEEAFKFLCQEKIEVIKYYKDRFVHSAHKAWQIPAVVRLITGYLTTNKQRVKYSRENVWLRDRGKCGYCSKAVSKAKFTLDHVVPRASGGVTKWENVVTSCRSCNQYKADNTPEQAGMVLRIKPMKPASLPKNASLMGSIPEEWKEVVSWFKK